MVKLCKTVINIFAKAVVAAFKQLGKLFVVYSVVNSLGFKMSQDAIESLLAELLEFLTASGILYLNLEFLVDLLPQSGNLIFPLIEPWLSAD